MIFGNNGEEEMCRNIPGGRCHDCELGRGRKITERSRGGRGGMD